MTRRDATEVDSAGEAARLFVRADGGEPGGNDELAAWLAKRPERERALERVELAVVLGRRLATEPGSALYAEAALAASTERRRERAMRGALAWGGALAAASVLVAFFLIRGGIPPADSPDTRPIEAARAVAFDAPSIAAAVLPNGAVVDASAVAVLPFSTSGDATLAAGLERDVVAALRTVPGLYVIADDAVRPYAATDLSPEELGGQLGARGIVDAAVERVGGRVHVSARLREAATGATLWRVDVERPVDELRAIRYEIAQSVAATMLDSELRERAARAIRRNEPVSASKPFLQ